MLVCYYHFMGAYRGVAIKDFCFPDEHEITASACQYREFLPVGFSVGRACAHGHTGDTVASVQIRGLCTLTHGASNVQTGDLIQMYIPDAEGLLFNKEGGRLVHRIPADVVARLAALQ